MNKAIKCLDKTISFILIVLVGFLAVGVSVSIVLRYFFGLSFAALEESLSMSFVAITLFGCALAVRERQHISISFLADKFVGKSKVRRIAVDLIVDLIVIFICAVMFYYSCIWIAKVGDNISPNTYLPMKVYYIMMPITMGLTIVYTVLDIVGHFVKIEESDGGYSTDDKLPEVEA